MPPDPAALDAFAARLRSSALILDEIDAATGRPFGDGHLPGPLGKFGDAAENTTPTMLTRHPPDGATTDEAG